MIVAPTVAPDRAQQLEQEIVRGLEAGRTAAIYTAKCLTEYIEGEGWRHNYETLNEFLSQGEVGMSRTDAFRLIRVYRGYVLDGGVPHAELAGIDPTKLDIALPGLTQVHWKELVSDCRVMPRGDVQEKYRGSRAPSAKLDATAEPEKARCPTCQSWVDVDRIGKP